MNKREGAGMSAGAFHVPITHVIDKSGCCGELLGVGFARHVVYHVVVGHRTPDKRGKAGWTIAGSTISNHNAHGLTLGQQRHGIWKSHCG